MKILVSACLLGFCTRYDGRACADSRVLGLAQTHDLVPVCPEQLGGLATPRAPAEIQPDGRVVDACNQNVTQAFCHGAQQALAMARLCGCEAVVLKARSPCCGKGQVYDGSFAKRLVAGNGVLAQACMQEGIPVFTEDELEQLDSLEQES